MSNYNKKPQSAMDAISRSFGISQDKIIETVKRVEGQRCDKCGALSCAHIEIGVGFDD